MQNVSVAQRRDATAGSSSISRVAKEEVFVTTSLYDFPKDQMDIRVIESLVLAATDATPEQIRATLQRAEVFYANHAPNPFMFHNFNALRKGVTEGWMKFKIVLDNLASTPHLITLPLIGGVVVLPQSKSYKSRTRRRSLLVVDTHVHFSRAER